MIAIIYTQLQLSFINAVLISQRKRVRLLQRRRLIGLIQYILITTLIVRNSSFNHRWSYFSSIIKYKTCTANISFSLYVGWRIADDLILYFVPYLFLVVLFHFNSIYCVLFRLLFSIITQHLFIPFPFGNPQYTNGGQLSLFEYLFYFISTLIYLVKSNSWICQPFGYL